MAIFVFFVGVPTALGASLSRVETVFRFHISGEPSSLDPARLAPGDMGYYYPSLARGLYSYTTELVPEGAERCVFESSLKIKCRLRETKWSDGTAVEARDYVRAFQRLVSPETKSTAIELLRNLKNALKIHSGSASPESLGMRAEGKDRLLFEFEKADPEFILKLSASVLVPVRSESFPPPGEVTGLLFNGPYRLTSWMKGRKMRLEANPHYARGNPGRPPVEILFIDDDQTAMNLYEQKQLSFLKRLPTTYIPKYRDRPDFKQVPMARFDYLGFGDELKSQPDLRAALSYAADFREMQKMLDALGTPGCPSLPEGLADSEHCVKFDLERARRHWEKVPLPIRKKRAKLMFTRIGGDDLQKSMEWFQAQWKKNLGYEVDLESQELKSYLETLRRSPPAVYRKGVGLERPTCLAALENFAGDGAENFMRLAEPEFDKLVARLASGLKPGQTDIGLASRKACGQGLQYLLDHHWLIPLGRIHFTILADPRFRGWTLSEMNQFDLANLVFR